MAVSRFGLAFPGHGGARAEMESVGRAAGEATRRRKQKRAVSATARFAVIVSKKMLLNY